MIGRGISLSLRGVMRTSLCFLAMITAVRGIVGQQSDGATVPLVAVPRPALIECSSASTADTLCVDRDAAVALARRANPGVAVVAALVRQAAARRVEATALPEPDFSADWEEGRGLFGSGAVAGHPVSATVTIPFLDKFRLQRRIGDADLGAARADSVGGIQQLVAATGASYDALLAALRRRGDLTEMAALAEDFVDRTQGRLDAGTAARLDLLKAQVDAQQAANDLIVAERDVVTARAGLNRLMGRPLDAGLLVADSLAVPPPVPATAVLIAAALAHRPELASLTQQQRGARAATTLAKEFWLPDVTIGVGRDFADPGPGVLMTGISLPIPIFYFQHAKGEIAEAKWHEHELAATERDLRAAIAEEVLTLATATDAATRQARFLADQMLPAAREAYRIAASSYALGGSSALDVLDARRSLLDAEDQFTAALLEANQTRTDLERAVAAPLTTLGAGVSDDR